MKGKWSERQGAQWHEYMGLGPSQIRWEPCVQIQWYTQRAATSVLKDETMEHWISHIFQRERMKYDTRERPPPPRLPTTAFTGGQ